MTTPARVSSPRFVGRREELARLESLLDAARAGRPSAVVVSGDAGIGKTRMCEELSARAGAVGVEVFTGRCVDVGEDVLPFGPLVEVMHQVVRACGVGRVLELAGPTGDELARLAPVLASGGSLPEATRASGTRMYLALTALLKGLAARRPLLLVIEDLHWVDRSSRDLLALIVRALEGRMMLVLTMRSDELPASDSLLRFLAELERSGAHRMRLAGLDRQEQARQIAAILGVPPTSGLVDRIHGRAEGNPLFAEELVAADTGDDLPSGILDLLLSRVRSLPADAAEVVEIGAMAGRRVGYGLLSAVVGFDERRLDAAVRAAVDHHVLVPGASGDGFSFRHALLRDAITSMVLPGRAARVHGRLAQALAERPELGSADGYGVAARVAHHWHLAGDARRTLVASLAAAAEAEEALAWPTALASYERAIALFEQQPDLRDLLELPRYRIYWAAAETAHLSAHPVRAAELIRAAIAAVDLDDPGSVDIELHYAYLHERLGRYLWMGADGGALAAYRQAVALVPSEVPSCWQAAIYSGYGQMLMLLGRFRESVGWCERAIDITGVVEYARSTEGHARNNLGVNLAYLGDVESGIAHLEAARTIAEEEFDDVDDIARAIVNMHSVLLDAGRLEEAAVVAIEGIEIVDRLGLARRKGVWCRCSAAETLLRLGRVEEAQRYVDEAVGLEPEGIDAVRTALVRGLLRLQRGDHAAAAADLAEARRRGAAVLDGQIVGPLYTALVSHLLVEDPGGALEVAEEGHGRLAEDEDAAFAVPLYAAAVRAAAEAAVGARSRGDDARLDRSLTEVERWLDRAQGAVDRDPARKPQPAAHLRTALAERARATDVRSAELWSEAAAAWQERSEPQPRAYCAMRQAEAHLADGDRGRAAAALIDAEAAADASGSRQVQEQITTLARRSRLSLRGAAEPDADGSTGGYRLTTREQEVLGLVAEGHTDRQIGERLFISHRTVERHVSNILAKLGAGTRTEASAIAHRQELLLAHGRP